MKQPEYVIREMWNLFAEITQAGNGNEPRIDLPPADLLCHPQRMGDERTRP